MEDSLVTPIDRLSPARLRLCSQNTQGEAKTQRRQREKRSVDNNYRSTNFDKKDGKPMVNVGKNTICSTLLHPSAPRRTTHHTGHMPERARRSLRHRLEKQRAFDAAQREDGDYDGGWRGQPAVRAIILNPVRIADPPQHSDIVL